MDERKIKILYSIIQDFICTGEPVGSRTLSKKYDLGISSATIRNEMSDLEELGFLEQVHTSSGRKPSTKGYRLYVDKLMRPVKMTKEEEKSIKSDLVDLDLFDIENVLRDKLSILSRLTNMACILKIPPVVESSIMSIQFIKITENSLLAVIITNEGIIRNSIIKLHVLITQTDIDLMNKVLNQKLAYRTIEDINLELIEDAKRSLKSNGYIFDQIISSLYEALTFNKIGECYVEGINNIFSYPEFSDIDKARNFLCFLNNRVEFEKVFSCTRNYDVEIRIGEENCVKEAKNYSIVLGNYGKNQKIMGTIGIIGPTRMNYSKVVSVLKSLIDFINMNIY